MWEGWYFGSSTADRMPDAGRPAGQGGRNGRREGATTTPLNHGALNASFGVSSGKRLNWQGSGEGAFLRGAGEGEGCFVATRG